MAQAKEKLKYEYDVDLNSDSAAANVIRFTGNNKNVLEIGAGPGSISRVLCEVNDCRVTALEIAPDAVQRLKEFCHDVIAADLNDAQWSKAFPEKYDVVIAADVLEHLYDPLSTLCNMCDLLNDKGYVLLSLPHVAHATIAACLWDEDFGYREWGLLDKTHVRFFGLKNIQALVQQAGMKIAAVEFVVRTPEQTEFAALWARLTPELQNAFLSNPFSCVYQVVLKAVPDTRADAPVTLMQQTVRIPPRLVADVLLPAHGLRGRCRDFLRNNLSDKQKNMIRSVLRLLKLRA